MKLASVLIAAAALAAAMGASAEPAQPTRPPSQQETRQPQLVLASADAVRAPDSPAAEQPASTPKRPRIARVTTCRCGGEPQTDAQQER